MTSEEITSLKERILAGGAITDGEAYALAEAPDAEALYDAAEELTRKTVSRRFDSCSIANVRSGLCPEDCKWCAQSRHAKTGIDTYPLLDEATCLEHARAADRAGIGRFSLVASGRRVQGAALDAICSTFRAIGAECRTGLCASLGLLGPDELRRLREAGVTRYHCNLEAGPSFFKTVCSTHTTDDKLATLRAARDLGFEVCSGGIIGMGETMAQRVELALTLRQVKPLSIPINLLHPIPGTPLENAAPLSEEEILRTVAVFRFVHPGVQLRFAGGRALMSEHTQLRAMRIAVNGAIVGDLLTTIGSTVDADRKRIAEAGYEF